MQADLWTKPALYTIDSCCLMAIFSDTPWQSKDHNLGLWSKVEGLLLDGTIISHAEVLSEIKKDGENGEELYNWAHTHSHIFKPHDIVDEGKVIRSMSPKYADFVNGKIDSCHADPWLIAQAKVYRLKIITEETLSGTTNPKKFKIPNVCKDSAYNIQCINLWELTKEQGWKFQA